MKHASDIRKAIFGSSQDQAENRQPRRSISVPSLAEECWVPKERKHTPGEIPRRSVSVKSYIKHIPQAIAESLTNAIDSQSIAETYTEDEYSSDEYGSDEYNSDEEDRRNGVPMTFSEDHGGRISTNMSLEVYQKIKDNIDQREQLQDVLATSKRRYQTAYDWYARTKGKDWDAQMFSYFTELEELCLTSSEKMLELEDELNHLEAYLYSIVL
ncbi:hypothetical protein M426DRAFT_24175 [Hypoxylon sp. CI-4A]|nr:hypothetical protein M426DRAFT_24175 [Hypoxylon sp. CI-4A]